MKCRNCSVRKATNGTMLCTECREQMQREGGAPAAPGEPRCDVVMQSDPFDAKTRHCHLKPGHAGAHASWVDEALDADLRQGVLKAEEDMREYRRTHFAVECRPSTLRTTLDEPELLLRATTNGTQWQTIGFYADEIPKVVTALQQARLAQVWPALMAKTMQGDAGPYAAAFVEFQAALDRDEEAQRTLIASRSVPFSQMSVADRDTIRDQAHAAHVHVLALFNRLLGQLQNAGLLPATANTDEKGK